MKQKIMITGPEGFLGGRIAAYYERDYEVIRAGRGSLDIRDEEAAAAYVRDKSPGTVIHCAALSDTGMCEKDPGLSEDVNRKGAVNLARACRESGSRLLFMSSDQVYGGSRRKGPNRETDEAPPVSVYGKHKRQAEEEIMEILPHGICLRLPWLYDFPVRGLKSNASLLSGIWRAMIQNRPIELPVYDYRGITWVWEVVKNLEPAMRLPGGIYNFGSESALSTYETGRRVLKMLDKNGDRGDLVVPDETRFADCPRNLTMDIGKIRAHGLDFPETAEGFGRCFHSSTEYLNAFIGGPIVEF
ncbi:sugar nucleotide-binding protein [Lachnospiraceae bacterium 54-53]